MDFNSSTVMTCESIACKFHSDKLFIEINPNLFEKNGALCADCFFTSVNSIDRFAKADSYSVNFQISTSVVCLRSIPLNQNYNKILEHDWLSPAPFEH